MERVPPPLTPAGFGRSAVAVAVRPWLWRAAILQAARLAPRHWWRRWPPDPRPDPAYLRFRLQTQYGDPEHEPEPGDVVEYLEWCRSEGRHLG